MEKGPFVKDHILFKLIKLQNPNGFMGVTYENYDSYAGIWFTQLHYAESFRQTMNKEIGWNIMSKPDPMTSMNDLIHLHVMLYVYHLYQNILQYVMISMAVMQWLVH